MITHKYCLKSLNKVVSQPAVIVQIHDLREGITNYNIW